MILLSILLGLHSVVLHCIFFQLFYFQSNPSELFQLLNLVFTLTFLNGMLTAILDLWVLDTIYSLPTMGDED